MIDIFPFIKTLYFIIITDTKVIAKSSKTNKTRLMASIVVLYDREVSGKLVVLSLIVPLEVELVLPVVVSVMIPCGCATHGKEC